MATPTVTTISSFTTFANEVHAALTATRGLHGAPAANWYRGCGQAISHKLLPSLYRHPSVADPDKLLVLEKKMLEWFKRRSWLYKTMQADPGKEDSNLEYLFFMQHYSVPTRVLDWTDNPFIALYFALTSTSKDTTGNYPEDAAVWLLDPISWNEKTLHKQGWGKKGAFDLSENVKNGYAPRTSEDDLDLKAMHEGPAALYGIANNARMFAQRGVFTIFGRRQAAMEVIYDTDGYPAGSLKKFVIPKGDIDTLLSDLSAMGYTDSAAYPDLHGLSMEIRRCFGFKL